MSLQVQPPVLGQVSLSAHFRESIAFFVSDLGNHSNRIISPPSCPSPDLIRGLSRASTPFLRHLSKQDVDGRDKPGHDSGKVVRHDQNALQGPMVATPLQPFGGSQSMQAPIAAVTALVLLPIHGGMTAPKPPAGPPAATTRRCSGDSSAAGIRSPRSRTIAPFPTPAHSARRTRARSYKKSAMLRLVQPARSIGSRSCFGITIA